MTEEQFFGSVVKEEMFTEGEYDKIDCACISLEDLFDREYFYIQKGEKIYISCEKLVSARAWAEEFLRLTDGWSITEEDIQDGFKRFEGKIEIL